MSKKTWNSKTKITLLHSADFTSWSLVVVLAQCAKLRQQPGGMGWKLAEAKAQSSPITDTHSLSRLAGFLLWTSSELLTVGCTLAAAVDALPVCYDGTIHSATTGEILTHNFPYA